MTRGLSHRGNIVREQIRRTGLDCISKRKPALNPMRAPDPSKTETAGAKTKRGVGLSQPPFLRIRDYSRLATS